MKFTFNKEDYTDYMPRIIKALIKARNWFLVCETNTFVTEQVYLNPKNKSSFLLINYKKQLNESFNECANFSKKIRITTETHAKSKEQNTARVGRSKTKMSVIVSNEKLNSFYIRGLYALSTLFSKENVELLQKEIGLQHPDFDFTETRSWLYSCPHRPAKSASTEQSNFWFSKGASSVPLYFVPCRYQTICLISTVCDC